MLTQITCFRKVTYIYVCISPLFFPVLKVANGTHFFASQWDFLNLMYPENNFKAIYRNLSHFLIYIVLHCIYTP